MSADLKGKRETDSDVDSVLAELTHREPIFHRPEFGTTRADFDDLMAPGYWEVGASGRRYDREWILDELEKRYSLPHEDHWETLDFECRRLAVNLYLLTYTLIQNASRVTRRATIWQRTEGSWKILYHQGTVVQDPDVRE